MKLGKIEKWFMNRPRHSIKLINHVKKLINLIDIEQKQNFLEIGCGNGVLSKYIAEKYKLNVTGIDIDGEQIILAKKNSTSIKNISFSEADATNLPFKDNNFDIILSINVLHHISNWIDTLKEVKRVLKPKGYFILVDLFYPNWTAKIGRKIARNVYGSTTIDNLNSFIKDNNFSKLYSQASKSFLWNNYKAIYQRN